MAAYYHGGAGTDIHQAGSDGLQTLYLMNPSYGAGGFGDAAPSGTNMMFLNSAVSSMTPASFGAHQASPSSGQHFVGIPLQAAPSGYNLWTPATTSGTDVMSPPTHQAHGVSAVLSLSSRETPPVTVAAVAGDEGRYQQLGVTTAASQGQMVMNSKYLRAAQELLDEVVSVSKGVDDVEAARAASAAKSAASVRKKEDSEGMSGGGGEDGAGGSKSSGAPEMSTAERQELQMKKGKLVNMLDEVEQRYRQYHQQMASVSSSFEAVAGAGSARTYTSLALRTISRQFRCLRDAIASQVRAACRALGEEDADMGAGGGRGVGSRLRYIDHQLRQQRALQQLGMMQSSAWRPQRGLPERSVSILRAWLFEHFLHPYPKDSDKIMLAKQTGLTRSQVSNWFINARVRLWKPMVEEMYLEETKEKQEGGAANADEAGRSGPSGKADVNDGANETPRSMARASAVGTEGGSKLDGGGAVHASLLGLTGDHRVPMGFYDAEEDEDEGLQGRGFKKARAANVEQQQQQPPPSYDVAALHHAQAAAAAAARQQHDEVSHRELLMKFMESGAGARDHHQQDDVDGGGGGYSLFAPSPYGQFGSDQAPFAYAGQHGGVSLTLGLPHGAGDQTASFLMGGGSSNGADNGGATAGYDMNMQTTKSFAAQLMGDYVA
ncbi:BEL1-like homeodomain protein 1 [Lolium perenne]|uniref:BEL1-like homeodomain protein 1 n=1 Tax=Lolium perenne TaxID=4522 RepID=UPI0021EA3ADE|nr:BEL1-like homeodomain protein 1 [Lolium perenne]XP_051180020.1 BEL1-like homeodomain protein 1 [Lolium perenne]